MELFNLGIHTAGNVKNVEPAIVVQIHEAGAPANILRIDRKTGGKCRVIKKLSAEVVIKDGSVATEVREEQIQVAVAVVISHGYSHSGLDLAIGVHGTAGFHANFRKGPIMIIAEEEIGSGITSYENVGPAVVVVIKAYRRQPIAFSGPGYAGLFRDFGEGSIAVVVVKRARLFGQSQRAAGNRHALELAHLAFSTRRALFKIKVDVAGNEQVESAVAVVINEGAARREARAGLPKARLFRDVRKSTVAVVMIEAVCRRGFTGRQIAKHHPAGDKDIQPAVAVVIVECDARAVRFKNVLLAEFLPIDHGSSEARPRSHIDQRHRPGPPGKLRPGRGKDASRSHALTEGSRGRRQQRSG